MKMQSLGTLRTALMVTFAIATPALAQGDADAQAVRSMLSGKTMMLTFRDGGPLYGTTYQIYVAFCPSGNYISQGGSSRFTVMDNEERRSFNDQGKWAVIPVGPILAVQYRSVSGQVNWFPVQLLPGGGFKAGNGITVIPQGPAPCK